MSAAVRAAAVLAALVLLFLWTPLTRGGYYAGADILQHFAIFHVSEERYDPKNSLIGDTVLVMFPGIGWSAEEIRHGRLPLWNPYNGWGVPHLAGFQSGVFSPYILPFYVLPFRHALVLSSFARLFGFGLLTWLFLRRIGCGAEPALLGAVAFLFGGYNVLWLHYPLSAATLVVPAGMYLAEVALQATSAAGRGLALLAFTLSLAAALLGGHPETFFFGALLVGGWILFRVASLERPLARLAGFALAGLAALSLCAVQLLPFLEYLRASTTFSERTEHGFLGSLHPGTWPLLFFPKLLGDPNRVYAEMGDFAGVNYVEANTAYVGLFTLVAAAWALLTIRRHRSREAAFFGAVAIAWVLYAYDVAGIGGLAGRLPLFSLTVPHRSQAVWMFAVSCLAAIGVDQTLRGRAGRTPEDVRRFGAAMVAGALVAGAAVYVTVRLHPPPGMIPMRMVALHVAVIVGSTGAGIAALARLAAPEAARGALAVLVAVVFLQTGLVMRDFNPTIEDRYFYPRTAALQALAAEPDAQTLFADAAWVPANVNLWYRLRSVWHYDGIGVARPDWLRRRLVGSGRLDLGRVTPRALSVLGIQRVVTSGAPPFDGRLPGLERRWEQGRIRVYAVPGALPRVFTVGSAVTARSDEEAVGLLTAPAFDPAASVVLHDGAPVGAGAPGGTAEIVSQSPTALRLRVTRTAPGWVVALQSHYPGWTATVNGAPAPLLRANVAFTAVAVPAGASDVRLRYQPASVRVGAWISGATLAALALFAAGIAAAPRLRDRRRTPPDLH